MSLYNSTCWTFRFVHNIESSNFSLYYNYPNFSFLERTIQTKRPYEMGDIYKLTVTIFGPSGNLLIIALNEKKKEKEKT